MGLFVGEKQPGPDDHSPSSIVDWNQLSENEIGAADCSTGSFRRNIGKSNLVRSS